MLTQPHKDSIKTEEHLANERAKYSTYYQTKNNELKRRGYTHIHNDSKMDIKLLKDADFSTYSHETAYYMLESMKNMILEGRLLYANTQKIKRWYQTSSESNPLRADKNALSSSSIKTEDDLVKVRSDSGNILYKNQKETDVVLQNRDRFTQQSIMQMHDLTVNPVVVPTKNNELKRRGFLSSND